MSQQPKRSYFLTGIRNLIEIARFSSWLSEVGVIGDILIRKVSKNEGKQKNIRDSDEYEFNPIRRGGGGGGQRPR